MSDLRILPAVSVQAVIDDERDELRNQLNDALAALHLSLTEQGRLQAEMMTLAAALEREAAAKLKAERALKTALEENERLDGALTDIADIALGRDGYTTAERLGELVDELGAIARSRKPVSRLDLPMKRGGLYQGTHVAVRPVSKKDGSVGYAIYRSGDRRAVLDEFPTVAEANLVASYVEVAGGSYEAGIRKEARKFAKENA